ncbi:hypothetical protein JCM10213_003552 [Rhodosporidiobolus nylandii]
MSSNSSNSHTQVDRTGLPTLLALRDELNAALAAVETSAMPVPSLDAAKVKSGEAVIPRLSKPAKDAVDAAREMLALLQGPSGVVEKTFAPHAAAALRVAVEVHVAETLREANEEGKPTLHVDEIAKSSAIEPAKLARVLRLLAANHIFREVEPNCFSNNRCSIILDTGKSVEELKSTKDWFTGTNGIAAFTTIWTNEGLKGAAFLAETLLSPSTATATDAGKAATCRALGIEVPLWENWAKETQGMDAQRFAAAMIGSHEWMGEEGDASSYPFKDLPAGATVVDVGSGSGAVALRLVDTVPQINLVLEDLPETIKAAQAVWEKEHPNYLKSGKVKLLPHDFFTPQPVKGAEVYLLGMAIHDWSTPFASQILKHLSEAASPQSKLLLLEPTYKYLSSSSSPADRALLGYPLDIQVLECINGQERTREDLSELGEQSGWRMKEVWTTGEGGREGKTRVYEFEKAPAAAEGGQ